MILALAVSDVTTRPSTTTSGATMAVVKGPIRHMIGRAFGLLSQKLQGGSMPAETYMGSQENNYAYNSITYGRKRRAKSMVAAARST